MSAVQRAVVALALLALSAGAPAAALIDDWRRPVVLQGPAQRIVSLAPHATELLFSAGLGERVVAVDSSSDFPPEVRKLPAINAAPVPDPERLMALRPDLVVVWGAGVSRDQVARLERLGLVVFVSEPRTLEAIANTLERFAGFSGDPARGIERASRFRARIAALRARFGARAPVDVFLQAWPRPLIALSDRDTVGDALALCGGRNVFRDLGTVAAPVGVESVLRAAPRLIVATSTSPGREPWSALGVLAPAGPIGFAEVDSAIERPSLRVTKPIEQLCAAIDAVR
ncbi:MAG: ABC transporter substrate-binding protein [Burkholderiaceae bacterium]|nr:ABC transporter substrate-binding protein [Burkholderiaceae bacterium]